MSGWWAGLAAVVLGTGAPGGTWQRLPSLPDPEGFAGSFAGVSSGALLVAGGANFPGKKPWEGGAKAWTDAVFVLDAPGGKWAVAGKLPRPLGYGVSVTHRGGVVCVGGSDAARHYPDAFRLDWTAGQLATTPLPPLPRPVANGCGALVGDTLYVAGGQESPTARSTLDAVYALDLAADKPAWRAVPPCPGGGRMLAVAAGFGGAFWLVGGVDLVGEKPDRRYLRDAYRYNPAGGWKRIADLPHPVAAAPSPAPTDVTGFFLLGGDDGSQVGIPPAAHRGFGKTVLRFDARTGNWVKAGGLPAPRVTAPCVRWGVQWVVPSGEARPGVRSPEVWGWVGRPG
ncbi:MAG: hypothetical protein U0871_00780 [Gemmataceae bacterium]